MLSSAGTTVEQCEQAGRELFVRLFPYVAAARLRRTRTTPEDPFSARPPTSPGAPLNRIGRQRRLSDPTYRAGVGISTDTLYTSAWLDLAHGPMVLESPRFDGRYYSFQFANADTSSDHAYGSRTHGDQLPPVFVHGPEYRGTIPTDLLVVGSTTRYLNLPGRMLIDLDDPADLARAHLLQDQVRLRSWDSFRSGSLEPAPVPTQVPGAPTLSDPFACFLGETRCLVEEQGLNGSDREWLVRHPVLGPLLNAEPETKPYPGSLLTGLAAGQALVAQKAAALGIQTGGWTVNLAGPRFGTDHLLRAAVARDQIYVTIPEEGVYPVGKTDDQGRGLNGAYDYEVHFAADALPPVSGFWSVTLYSAQGYLEPNEAGIYSVGDRGELQREPDGSVRLLISRQRPEGAGNWLPSVPDDFYLMLRLFVPAPEIRTGVWLPPAITRVG